MSATLRRYELYTYDDIWEKAKKKLKMTDRELKMYVESLLQMNAWGDIIVLSPEWQNEVKEDSG